MDRALLESLLAERLTLKQMGERVGKDATTVGYWLKKHGLKATHHDRFAPKRGLDREALESLLGDDLAIPEVARRLSVRVSTVRYWMRRHGLETQRMRLLRMDAADRPKYIERRCLTHGVTRWVSSGGRYRCLKCRASHVMRRRRRVKEILVEEAGGRCEICGYSRFVGALEFHHLDPTAKAFSLAQAGVTRSIARARAEAGKCVLLCSNCHAEVEGGIATITSEIRSRVAER